MKIKFPNPANFLDIPNSFDDETRRQRLLAIIAGGLCVIAAILLIWAVLTWVIGTEKLYEDWLETVIACTLVILGTIVILILNRFRFGFIARLFFVALLLSMVFFDTKEQIANGRNLLIFALPIIASAILLRPWAGFVLAAISAIIVEIYAHLVSSQPQPLPSIAVFFLLATFIWMSTSSLERHILQLRKNHTSLKESEERYRTLMEISPDMVILSDPEGKILMANPASLTVMGFADASEVIGKRVWEFIAPEDRQRAIANLSALVKEGSVEPGEYSALTQTGQTLFVELSGSLLSDQAGKPQAVLSVGRDITLRKKTEQALLDEKDETYQALVNNSAQGMVLIQNGQVVLANKAIAESMGLTLDEVYSLSDIGLSKLVHPDDRLTSLANMWNRLDGKPAPTRYEIRVAHKDGVLRWLEVMPTVITLRGIPTLQVTTIDITERKSAEEALQITRDQLEATLNTLPDFLFELDREKRFCSFRSMKSETFFPNHQVFIGKTVMEAMPPHVAMAMSAALDDALLHGQHHGATYEVDMPTGKYWFELSISTLGDMNLPAGRFIMLVRDITERKNVENALRLSENKYRRLHESMIDGFVLVDMQGRILDSNESYQQMLGYNFEELAHLTYLDLTPKKWQDFEHKIVTEQILPRGYSEIYEKEYQKKDGRIFPVELRTFLVQNEIGENEGMWAIVRDISDRKRTEEALRKSEERYRSLAENAQDVIVIVNPEDRIEYINRYAAALIGITPAEAVGAPRARFFPSPTSSHQSDNLRRVFEGGQPLFMENQTPFPTGKLWLSTWLVPLKNETGKVKEILVISRDITERRQMEETLRESEKRYRDLFQSASLAVFQTGLNGKLVAVNPEFARMFGYQSPEEVINSTNSVADVFADPQRREEIIRLRAENPAMNSFENVYRRKDGSTFIGQLNIRSITDQADRLKYFEGFIEDITPRKQTEAALRESEVRYRSLAETAHDIIVIVDTDDRIVYVNKFGAKLIKMTPEEVIGSPRSRFFPSTDVNERHRANFAKVIERGQPIFTESRTPIPAGELWLSNWMVPLKDETGKVKEILAISRDITERKALEEALLEAKVSLEQRVNERTEDLMNSREQLRWLTRQTVMTLENERRRLARELHDEAGQVLIGLQFTLDEIQTETSADQEKLREKISQAITRISNLHQQIRGLAHDLRPPILDVAGINLTIKDLCRTISTDTHLPVIYSGSDNLPPLSDEISITLYRFVQEALNNVVRHAHAHEAYVSLRCQKNRLVAFVKDNGTGFSVAATSKGVGLLGMEERLNLLGGKLDIRSSRRHGTRLRATIPLERGATGL